MKTETKERAEQILGIIILVVIMCLTLLGVGVGVTWLILWSLK